MAKSSKGKKAKASKAAKTKGRRTAARAVNRAPAKAAKKPAKKPARKPAPRAKAAPPAPPPPPPSVWAWHEVMTREYRQLIDDANAGQAFAQIAYAAIDLGKLLLAVDVFGVFGAVALCGGLGNGTRHRGPLDAPELVELALEPRGPFRRDVFGTRA